MKLIVGLGNPGDKYEQTPHNAGFIFVRKLAQYLHDKGAQVSDWKKEDSFESYISTLKVAGNNVAALMMPQTYMNLSGSPVKKFLNKKELGIDSLIVAHDDLDIKFGEYKIQFEKSPKGHNGIIDIENKLSSKGFWRVRIGVDGRKDFQREIPGKDYVLMKLSRAQMEELEALIDNAIYEFVEQFLPEIG